MVRELLTKYVIMEHTQDAKLVKISILVIRVLEKLAQNPNALELAEMES